MTGILPNRSPDDLATLSAEPVDDAAREVAREALDRVRSEGERALDAFGRRFDERPDGMGRYLDAGDLARHLASIDPGDRARLERIAGRIECFATAQRDALADVAAPVPGGRAGHTVRPVGAAGCYAPGGRYPLPSSVLMTAVTARVAGVPRVWVASPRPTAFTLAAAAVAGADGLLAAGGAHAVAALAFGVGPVPPCDVIVGPGNRYVTAAKQLLAGTCRIDTLAGPSELVVLADGDADPALVAADLLAQAEHDPDALPILVTVDPGLPGLVRAELARQLETLPTADVAVQALRRGGVAVVGSTADAVALCNRLAPEHLQVCMQDLTDARRDLSSYGAVFYGAHSAEVFGDYGIGPNHVLPTGGTARSAGGLSVLTFLRVNTWLELDRPPDGVALDDMTWLARVEGLEAHARAAERRRARLTHDAAEE